MEENPYQAPAEARETVSVEPADWPRRLRHWAIGPIFPMDSVNRPRSRLKMLLWLALVVAISPVVCAALAAVVIQLRSGINVTIKNTGQTKIHSLTLHVTGNSYSLGDLDPGESKEATVKSTGDSSLEIEFVDETGNELRLSAGGYFEPGYRGTFWISIKDGTIDTNEQHIDAY